MKVGIALNMLTKIIPHPRRERQARARAASCGIEKGLVR